MVAPIIAAGVAKAGLDKVKSAASSTVNTVAAPINATTQFAGRAAYGGLKQVGGAITQTSFLLFLLGGLHWYLKVFVYKGQMDTTMQTFSLLLFVIAGIAIATHMYADKFAVIIPMTLFFIWYFILQAPADLVTGAVFIGIYLGLLFIVGKLLTKGQALEPIIHGAWAAVFYFLDVGLLALIPKLGISLSSAMNSAIVWTPWWSVLGLYLFPSFESGRLNGFMRFCKFLGVVYLFFFVFLGFVPDAFGTSQDSLRIDNEAAQAQAALIEKELEGFKVNKGVLAFQCTLESFGKNHEECVAEKEIQAKSRYICKTIKEIRESELAESQFQQCLKEEANKQRKGGGPIQSTIDQTDEPIVAKFKVTSDGFPSKLTYIKGSPQPNFEAEFTFKFPREEAEASVLLSCEFEKTTGKKETFPGKISGYDGQPIVIKTQAEAEADLDRTVVCSPTQELKTGSYKVKLKAYLANLQTFTRVKKAFTKETGAELTKVKKDSLTLFSGPQSWQSISSGDLAHLKIDFGNKKNYHLIDTNQPSYMFVQIKNNAKGKIMKANYKVDFEGFSSSPAYCLEYTGIPLDTKVRQDLIKIPSCQLSISPELSTSLQQAYEPRTFAALLLYDYELEEAKTVNVIVKDPESFKTIQEGATS